MVDSEARHDSKPWGNLLDVASLLAAKWTVMASSNPLGRVWFLLALSDAGWLPLDQRAPLGVYLWELPFLLVSDRGRLLVLGVSPLLVHGCNCLENCWGLDGVDCSFRF